MKRLLLLFRNLSLYNSADYVFGLDDWVIPSEIEGYRKKVLGDVR